MKVSKSASKSSKKVCCQATGLSFLKLVSKGSQDSASICGCARRLGKVCKQGYLTVRCAVDQGLNCHDQIIKPIFDMSDMFPTTGFGRCCIFSIVSSNKNLGSAGDVCGSEPIASPLGIMIIHCRNTVTLTSKTSEPRSASGEQRTHQNLRSEQARFQRIASYQETRRKTRREYRQWLSDLGNIANLTLAQYCPPEKGAS